MHGGVYGDRQYSYALMVRLYGESLETLRLGVVIFYVSAITFYCGKRTFVIFSVKESLFISKEISEK